MPWLGGKLLGFTRNALTQRPDSECDYLRRYVTVWYSAATNETIKKSARVLCTLVFKLLSSGTLSDVPTCFSQWPRSDTSIISAVKQILPISLFLRLVARFIKLHMVTTIDGFYFMRIFAETGIVDSVAYYNSKYTQVDRFWTQRANAKIFWNLETLTIEKVNKKEAHSDGCNDRKCQNWARSAAQGNDYLETDIEIRTEDSQTNFVTVRTVPFVEAFNWSPRPQGPGPSSKSKLTF